MLTLPRWGEKINKKGCKKMKKKKRENILKEAGVILIATILVLTSIITVSTGTNIELSSDLLDERVTETTSTKRTVLLDEDFSGSFPPAGWTTDYWKQSNTNEAGGTPPEARVYKYDQYYGGQYYDNYIMTPTIDASECIKIVLEFKFAADIQYANFTNFYVKYRNDNADPWVDITPWENPLLDDFVGTYTVIIDGDPYCGNALQVKWEYIGYYYYYNYFYLDDVNIISGTYWIPFIPDSEPGSLSEIKLKSSDTMGIMVDSDIPGMYSTNVSINNTLYQKLNIPNEGLTTEIGKPEVPVIRRYLEIPYDVDLSVEIFYSDYTELNGYNVMPVQELIPLTKTKEILEIVEDNEAYSDDEFYPPYNALISEPFILRGHRILQLDLYPVQFNAATKQLRGYNKIEVKANYNFPAQIESIEERLASEPFEELLEAFVLNYKSPDEYETRRDSPPDLRSGADYLIITDDTFVTQVQPLADWKQKKGYITKLVKKSDIPGSGSANDITTYLQDAYNTWNPPPTYVLFVGDVKLDGGADGIPTHYGLDSYWIDDGRIGTDLNYSRLDGTDYFPDIFIGRLPVNTTANASTVINKILTYEKNPNWVGHGLICSSTEFSHAGCNTIVNLLTVKGYPNTFVEVTPGSNGAATQQIKNTINSGCFVVSHYDHGDSLNGPWGSIEGWCDPRFTTTNVSQLTNGDKLPIMFSMNCRSGWFDGETDEDSTDPSGGVDCLGERWLKANNKGGVGFIGSSRVAFDGYTSSMHLGFYDSIWPDFLPITQNAMYKLGQILTYGKINMVLDYGYSSSTTKVQLEEFHLFGDPEMSIITSLPQSLTVEHPTSIGSGGSQRFVVKVTDGTNPLPHALVCLQKGTEVHTSGYTDGNGYILFDVTPSTGGTLYITATKHNYLPHEGSILVTSGGAAVTVFPISGSAGDTITVTGSSFMNGETVDISLGGFPVGSTIAPGGIFITTVPVPPPSSVPVGPANFIAEGLTSARVGAADFYVLAAQPDPYIYSQWDSSTWHIAGGVKTWDNPDIILYDMTTGNPVPSNDLKLGTPYFLNATIHNDVTDPATGTQVTFSWAKWGSTPTFTPINTTTVDVPGPGTVVASVNWTPIVVGHCCLRVQVSHPSDVNPNNNLGQENTDVYPISSPGEIPFEITNPRNTSVLVCLEVTQRGERNDVIWAAQIERPYPQILDPEETQTAKLIVDAPEDVEVGETRTFTVTATIDEELVGGVEIRVVKLMDLVKPKMDYIYFFDRQIIPFPGTFIIGPITIEVEAEDFECGIDRVEFYIDDKLISDDTEEPFVWKWSQFSFGRRTIKVVAYNNCGISDSREMQVWKFF